MKKLFIYLIMFILVTSTLACNKDNKTTNNQNFPIVLEADVNAANIPITFYDKLNKTQYDEAVKLLGPQLAFEGLPEYRKYLINLENTVIRNFKDISNEYAKVNITPTEKTYNAIKIYYADLDITVRDKDLVPALAAPQHRIFIIVKVSKDGPWLLDSDEETPARS